MKLFVLLSILVSSVQAAPVGEAIFWPLQYPPKEDSVKGIRNVFGLGIHKDVYGLDVGLGVNVTNDDFIGMAIAGGANITGKRAIVTGIQFAGVMNRNRGKAYIAGLQFALGANFNEGSGGVYGVQLALAGNWASKTDIYGVQAGLINHASKVVGFQIGLINRCDRLYGIQIGLLNYAEKSPISFFPLINIGF